MTFAYSTTLHLQITLLHPSSQELSMWSKRTGESHCKVHAKYSLSKQSDPLQVESIILVSLANLGGT